MTPSQVLELYKKQAEIARVLGCQQSSVAEMFEKGKIPDGRQYQLQIASRGVLKADKPADRRRADKALRQASARKLMEQPSEDSSREGLEAADPATTTP